MQKPFAITLDIGSSLANHTGSWRTKRPVYVDRLPPCNHACPAGEDIQGWLYHAESGDYHRAWQSLVENNPMPAVMGRICYHPCETACNRGQLDQAVSIHAVERFLGDEAIRLGWKFEVSAPPSGKRALIVGAGPSGLSAAYHLARLGHKVSIWEAGPMAGGMMRFGIPKYRLPRAILDAEIARIVDLGVEIRLGTKISDLAAAMKEGHFDAAFLAVGAHLSRRTEIPARDASKILDALSVLRGMESGERPQLGRRVLIYGGGNTALDVARTAKRLGASEAVIVYRRNREHMPAHDSELQEALEEGIKIKWLSTIKEAGETSFTVEKMKLDDKGFPQPTGELETIEADSLILALGQDVRSQLPAQRRRTRDRRWRRQSRLSHDDRPSRNLRRRRYGAVGAHRDRGDRSWEESREEHRWLATRRHVRTGREARPRRLQRPESLVLHRCSEDSPAAARHDPATLQLR